MEELIEVYSQTAGAAHTNPKYQNIADKAHSLSCKAAEAMVDVYTNTRSKFTVDVHDLFLLNTRDWTLWVLQLLRYDIVSVDTFLDPWAYEANRIFRARLVGAESQDQFDSTLRNAMIQFFNADVDVEKLCYTSTVTLGDDGVPSGDLRRISMADYKKMVEEGLKSYEREVKDMPIDLFQEVMDHLACADRALSAPRHNDIMLVGRSGVGRRSLVSLIAHMQRLTVFSPATSRKYDDKKWKRDLKQVMQMTGIERQHSFLLGGPPHGEVGIPGEHQLTAELWRCARHLDTEPLLAPLEEEWATSQGRDAVQARTPFECFVHQVRSHMRIVLSMDANPPHFLTFCAANPALFSCCNVMWLDDWSEKSMHFVVQRQLTDVSDCTKNNLPQLLTSIHKSQFMHGASPRDFVTLLQTFKAIYKVVPNVMEGIFCQVEGVVALASIVSKIRNLMNRAPRSDKWLVAGAENEPSSIWTTVTLIQKIAASLHQAMPEYSVETLFESRNNLRNTARVSVSELYQMKPIVFRWTGTSSTHDQLFFFGVYPGRSEQTSWE